MKYIVLIYSNPKTWAHPTFLHDQGELSEEERERLLGQFGSLMEEISGSGELVGGEMLADPADSKVVRVRDGEEVVTDGPFAEAKEQLAGYIMLDCETPERAASLVARIPEAATYGVEIRPVMEPAGMEM